MLVEGQPTCCQVCVASCRPGAQCTGKAVDEGCEEIVGELILSRVCTTQAYLSASDALKDDKGRLSLGANVLCGIAAGTSEAIFAVTPIETLKSRVIDDMRRGTNKYTGSLDAIKKIVAADGIGGLYRGLSPTIMKQATNQAVRFRTHGLLSLRWLSPTLTFPSPDCVVLPPPTISSQQPCSNLPCAP